MQHSPATLLFQIMKIDTVDCGMHIIETAGPKTAEQRLTRNDLQCWKLVLANNQDSSRSTSRRCHLDPMIVLSLGKPQNSDNSFSSTLRFVKSLVLVIIYMVRPSICGLKSDIMTADSPTREEEANCMRGKGERGKKTKANKEIQVKGQK